MSNITASFYGCGDVFVSFVFQVACENVCNLADVDVGD